jgi:hypothetical protein
MAMGVPPYVASDMMSLFKVHIVISIFDVFSNIFDNNVLSKSSKSWSFGSIVPVC